MARRTATERAAAVNQAKPSTRTNAPPAETRSPTVVVACKLPTGLHLEMPHPSTGEHMRVTVAGPANARLVSNGFGLTSGVDRDFAEAWFKAYANYHPVKTGQIFIETDRQRAKDHAKENREVRTGLEPNDPNKLPAGLEKADGPSNKNADDGEDDDGEDWS